MIAQQVLNKNLMDGYPQITDTMALLAERPSIARVEADKAA